MGNIQRNAWPVLVILFAAVLVCVLYTPVAQAQVEESELSATIRATLLSDPRSQDLSQEELNGLVEALVIEAEEEGITAEDIMWRPEEPDPEPIVEEPDACGRLPKLLCNLNEAFGFSSGNLVIPVLLLVSSTALLFVLGLMIQEHRRRTPQDGGVQ